MPLSCLANIKNKITANRKTVNTRNEADVRNMPNMWKDQSIIYINQNLYLNTMGVKAWQLERSCINREYFMESAGVRDIHHFGGHFILNLSKMIEFAGTYQEITMKTKYQLFSRNVS